MTEIQQLQLIVALEGVLLVVLGWYYTSLVKRQSKTEKQVSALTDSVIRIGLWLTLYAGVPETTDGDDP